MNGLFSYSQHDVITGSAAHQALAAIVLDKPWLKDVKKFITLRYALCNSTFAFIIKQIFLDCMSYASTKPVCLAHHSSYLGRIIIFTENNFASVFVT